MTKEDIVIAGISARYPQADSWSEFKEKLLAGVELITDDEARWPRGFLGVPNRMGTIKDLSRFDASFFGVPPKQAHLMDPQLRILLETSYEAIMDAGYDPATLRGRKIGVFVGCSVSETLIAFLRDETVDPYLLTGSVLHAISNRVSYCLDFSGPSLTLDSASASTMHALRLALESIRTGECEAAIVAGTNIMVNPVSTLCEVRYGMLSPDGKCKTWNSNADGYVRAETIGAMFLQPVSQARRFYAKLIHAKANSDGYKVEGITVPSSKQQEQLLREVYAEAGVDPLTVTYIEAHGTGTAVGDPQEMAALSRFFCVPERNKPLKLGAAKTVTGHSEAASSISTISKAIIVMETGMIPPTLHFKDPNPKIPCLHDGSTEVIVKLTPFDGGPIGINAFGFGGTNVHAIFEANPGPHVDTLKREKPELPRLVLVSGRTQESLRKTLDTLEAEGPYPDSAYALLNRVGQRAMKQFPFRGYAIVPVDGSQKPVTKAVESVRPAKRPLWFMFTGMGCQWNGMARQMMQYDVFARSIRRSHDLLENFGLDLIDLVTSAEPRGDETAANTIVSIAAIQMALVDVIHAVGIQPDGILGHSMGEIASAYADGGLTAEQAILCAYWRGRCTDVGNLPRGAMAAVGLTWEEAKRRCRNGVQAACHNAEDSVTVSGPADAVAELVKELQAEGVFARVVNTLNVAFHSAEMQRVAPALLKECKQVLPEPKTRGKRWVSSSVPESHWNEPLAQHCSAEYFVNNLVSPVLFYEALQHVPRDAIVIEIAPHCLLLSILRRALGSSASCVGLMRKDADNHSFFLGSLGKLHTLGVQLDLSLLYPPVPWPVPRGTPNIGHLVTWDHSQKWTVASWKDVPGLVEGKDDIVNIDVRGNEAHAYLFGHRLGGEATFPVAGHLLLAWKSLCRRHGKSVEELPVTFKNVKVHRNVVLPENGPVRLVVTIMHSSGEFEVCHEGTVAASGSIRLHETASPAIDLDLAAASSENTAYELDSEDVYRDLSMRGYDYRGDFRGIIKSDLREPRGKLRWNENWVTFIDSVIQYAMFWDPTRELRMPTTIDTCSYDPYTHAELVKKAGDTGVDVVYNQGTDTCLAGGVIIRGIRTATVDREAEQQTPLVEEYRFVPYIDDKDSKDKRESFTREYVDVCCSVARQALHKRPEAKSLVGDIMCGVDDVPEHVVNQHLRESAESYGLLRFLHTVYDRADLSDTAFRASIQSALPAHKEDLEADILNTALFEEDPLRFLLDIVLENSSPKRLRILELAEHESASLLVTWLAKYLSEFSLLLNAEYTVTHPSTERLSGKVPQDVAVVPSGSASSRKKLSEADLIVHRRSTWTSSGTTKLAEEVSAVCRENSFVLLAQRTALTPAESVVSKIGGVNLAVATADEVEAEFLKNGLRLVAFKCNNLAALYLFRKRSVPIEEAKQEIVLVNTNDSDFVDSIKKKVLDYEVKPKGENIWLVAKEPGSSGVVGLANCLRRESGGSHIRCVFDAGSTGTNKVADFGAKMPEYKDVIEKDLVMNIYRNGQWGSYRHVVTKSSTSRKSTQFAVLDLRKRGDLSSLDWYESPLPYCTLPPTKSVNDPIVCDVHFAAVNRRDVMLAKGQLPPELVGACDVLLPESALGQEFSGTDQTGRRLMGLVSSQALATAVAADPILLWEVPDSWTLTEASTVPLAYSTAYYALLVRGNMRPGESVLVHGGSGCFGQAAIAVALSMGCTVFASVGSAKEKQFLKDHFPQLEDRNIVNYRNVWLEEHILGQTKQRGVDVVFDGLHGANVDVAACCLAPNGRYLFIDAIGNSSLGPRQESSSKRKVANNVIAIPIDALHTKDPCTVEEKRRVAGLLLEGIASGAVKPLPFTVFSREQVLQAFTSEAYEVIASKVVLQVRPEKSDQIRDSPSSFTVEAIARTYFCRNKAYIVVGEASTFALEVVNWIVTRGCRNILLANSRGTLTSYQRLCLHRWRTAGASVVVSEADVSTAQGALQVIKDAEAMGPVGGIFNLSLCQEDTRLDNQATEQNKAKYKTKADGTRHLDEHSRKLCPQLDYFVVFSSVCSGRGTSEMSMRGYVDSALERLCERRTEDGLPGLAIQWGPIYEDSTSSEAQGTQAVVEGAQPQKIRSCLEVMERFLNQSHPVVSSLVKAEVNSSSEKKPEKNPLVDSVIRILDFNVGHLNIEDKDDFIHELLTLLSIFFDFIPLDHPMRETYLEMFNTVYHNQPSFQDSSTLNPNSNLGDLGLDSIMGTQIVAIIEKFTGLALSVHGIRELTLSNLSDMSKEERVK